MAPKAHISLPEKYEDYMPGELLIRNLQFLTALVFAAGTRDVGRAGNQLGK